MKIRIADLVLHHREHDLHGELERGFIASLNTGSIDDRPIQKWGDWQGSVLTQAARVREQIRRPDFGHLEIQVTVDDPKAYTKPWTVTLKARIVIDAELIDEICLENEQSLKHLK